MQSRSCLVNCLSAKSGGAISYLRNLLPRLHQLAENSTVEMRFLCDGQQKTHLGRVDAERIVDSPTDGLSALKRIGWEKKNLPALVRDHDVDVVYTPYQILNAKTPSRNVIMVRNMEPFLFGRYSYKLKGRLRNAVLRRATVKSIGNADRVIAVSGFVSEYLEENYGVQNEKLTKIYHGRDTFFESGDDQNSESPDTPFILTCGSLLPYRRCEDVIRGFQTLLSEPGYERFRLLVAGQGTEPKYRSMLEELAGNPAISGRVEFTGHVEKEKMKQLFRDCSICVLATEIEACPNIAIEAMSSGCTILAADNKPLPEMLGEAALFYKARDISQLGESLVRLLGDNKLREELSSKAIQRSRRYDWDRCASETFSLLTNWS